MKSNRGEREFFSGLLSLLILSPFSFHLFPRDLKEFPVFPVEWVRRRRSSKNKLWGKVTFPFENFLFSSSSIFSIDFPGFWFYFIVSLTWSFPFLLSLVVVLTNISYNVMLTILNASEWKLYAAYSICGVRLFFVWSLGEKGESWDLWFWLPWILRIVKGLRRVSWVESRLWCR